eukprot:CAMPEP_0198253590 /NCGR_PEP_ID=MMETSP1447-20131203/3998_1 /TAXON_ID=420782 /ORGANISM="Chaetoceros dichaeta, Strain CCMP1751" /LENGTH=527 /DNA_ID=CAMNT_0043939325 /DNA_START=45 /DNA_END=1628 /DNA_ORIENTATION=-
MIMIAPKNLAAALVLLTSGARAVSHSVGVSGGGFYDIDIDENFKKGVGTYLNDFGVGGGKPDLDTSCAVWARRGECHFNHEYMFEHCIETCMMREDFGTIGYFMEYYEEEDEEDIDECINVDDSNPDAHFTCDELAEEGECHLNPLYMKENCARSCLQCLPKEVTRFDIGTAQEIMEEYEDDTEHIEETLKVITETHDYMQTKVMEEPAYEFVRRYCSNDHEYCSSMAAAGFCEDDDDNAYYYFMMTDCAPACQSCLTYELIDTCTPKEEDNIFKEGDLDAMFKRIVGKESQAESEILPDYEPVVHAYPRSAEVTMEEETIDGPWVVTLDNFLSDAECKRLIELGERSSDDADQYEEEENDPSTSLHSWCQSDCYNDPVMEGIIERMSDVTGIPEENSEYLQMLKYSAQQKYEEYTEYDLSEESYELMPGPTVVTVFLFLNDVEEGGEIRFDDLSGNGDKLSLDILPKKGSALILPSVQNDPSIIEERTLHQSLPVLKGVKYGVKVTFHLRSYDHDNCDYDAFSEWW